MKTSMLLVSLIALVGSATATYAGPGAQYWQQRRNPPASAQKAGVQKVNATEKETAPAKADAPSVKCEAHKGCSSCCAKA